MSAITGMMLSDGHIGQRSITGNHRCMFVKSGKLDKRDYFNFVLTLLITFCSANKTTTKHLTSKKGTTINNKNVQQYFINYNATTLFYCFTLSLI